LQDEENSLVHHDSPVYSSVYSAQGSVGTSQQRLKAAPYLRVLECGGLGGVGGRYELSAIHADIRRFNNRQFYRMVLIIYVLRTRYLVLEAMIRLAWIY